MADYYALVVRAAATLDKNTAEKRRALYERIRSGLINEARKTDPPLPESAIMHERLALEQAIRKLEAEQLARLARKE